MLCSWNAQQCCIVFFLAKLKIVNTQNLFNIMFPIYHSTIIQKMCKLIFKQSSYFFSRMPIFWLSQCLYDILSLS